MARKQGKQPVGETVLINPRGADGTRSAALNAAETARDNPSSRNGGIGSQISEWMDKQSMIKGGSMRDAVQGMLDSGEINKFGADNPELAKKAQSFADEALGYAKFFGISKLQNPKISESQRSKTDVFFNGDMLEEDQKLPSFPGTAYASHLFQTFNEGGKIQKAKKDALTNSTNVFTEQMDALKGAIAAMGIYSDRNPGGLPVDIKEAKKIFFGKDDDLDPIAEAEWRSTVEQGNKQIDPKKVRKFVNHDGSLTWEVLNDDKTVMSRFTLGDYAGTKIFAQGGYNKFAEILKKAMRKLGKDSGGEFDSIRSMFGG